jgi:thymidylate synthase ThyX
MKRLENTLDDILSIGQLEKRAQHGNAEELIAELPRAISQQTVDHRHFTAGHLPSNGTA